MGILDMFRAEKETAEIEDPTPEEIETAKENVIKWNRVEGQLAKLEALDAEAYEFYRTFEPEVTTEKIGSRTFVRFADREFIAEFVTDISVESLGGPPHTYPGRLCFGDNGGAQGGVVDVYAASQAFISVHYASGKNVAFWCNRHAVDAVYNALREAWLDALRLSDKPAKRKRG